VEENEMPASTGSEKTVVDLLVDQHMQIKSLFAHVLSATGEEKTRQFHDLVRLLAVHESAEEQVVHPMARRKITNGDPIVDARLEEEKRAKQELSDLYELGTDHPEFDTRLRAFAEDVIRHATAEETQEFEQLRATLSEKELVRMASAVRTAESIAPTRPHPAAGESAAANMLAGPPLALFDRIRDAMRGS
jgi:hemerythrin superfamily protein